jgi:hypothetical protein
MATNKKPTQCLQTIVSLVVDLRKQCVVDITKLIAKTRSKAIVICA